MAESENASSDQIGDMETVTLVSLNEIDEDFELLSYQVGKKEATQKVNQWVDGQDLFWPDELTPEVLVSKMRKVYIPYWHVKGVAVGKYEVSLGTDFKEYETCSSCRGKGSYVVGDERKNCRSCQGTGKVEKKKTRWRKTSDHQTIKLSERVENVSDNVPIECVENNFENATSAEIKKALEEFGKEIGIYDSENESAEELFYVLKPRGTGESYKKLVFKNAAKSKLKDVVKSGIEQSGADRYRNMSVSNVRKKKDTDYECDGRLYPAYFSEYAFGEKKYLVQIDGVTGSLSIQSPGKVKAKRIIAYILVVLILAVGVYGLGNMLNWW